jgi:hypothetical protein
VILGCGPDLFEHYATGYSPTLPHIPQRVMGNCAVSLRWEAHFVVFRLDYVSCVLTVISTILVGRRCWEGWILAGINSAIVCVIGYKTAQLGFIPANLMCIVLYGLNLRAWRKGEVS